VQIDKVDVFMGKKRVSIFWMISGLQTTEVMTIFTSICISIRLFSCAPLCDSFPWNLYIGSKAAFGTRPRYAASKIVADPRSKFASAME
jgi:hypothetical protein